MTNTCVFWRSLLISRGLMNDSALHITHDIYYQLIVSWYNSFLTQEKRFSLLYSSRISSTVKQYVTENADNTKAKFCSRKHSIGFLVDMNCSLVISCTVDLRPPGQNGRHFADDVFVWIFVNEQFYILIKILLKFVPNSSIDKSQALVYVTAWHR